jgi:hypothetical protein
MIYWRAVVHRKMQARFGGGTTEKGLLDTSLAAYPTLESRGCSPPDGWGRGQSVTPTKSETAVSNGRSGAKPTW